MSKPLRMNGSVFLEADARSSQKIEGFTKRS